LRELGFAEVENGVFSVHLAIGEVPGSFDVLFGNVADDSRMNV